jgi:threonine dehydrogenase-like Zn-dependent dehydrogenase
VLVTDVQPERLALAERFGADAVFNLAERSADDVSAEAQEMTDGRGADVAFEVCGQGTAVGQAIDALRIGGRYLIAGLVAPGQAFELDGNVITRKTLTVKGIHNYRPDHLGQALRFLESCADTYPYSEIVTAVFTLDQINEAIAEASTGRHIRVAIR